jgi:hypothetical protein
MREEVKAVDARIRGANLSSIIYMSNEQNMNLRNVFVVLFSLVLLTSPGLAQKKLTFNLLSAGSIQYLDTVQYRKTACVSVSLYNSFDHAVTIYHPFDITQTAYFNLTPDAITSDSFKMAPHSVRHVFDLCWTAQDSLNQLGRFTFSMNYRDSGFTTLQSTDFTIMACERNPKLFGCISIPDGFDLNGRALDETRSDYAVSITNTSPYYTGVIDSARFVGADASSFGLYLFNTPQRLAPGSSVNANFHFTRPKYLLNRDVVANLNVYTSNDSCGPHAVPMHVGIFTASPDTVYDFFHAPHLFAEGPKAIQENIWRLRNTSPDSISITAGEDIGANQATWYLRSPSTDGSFPKYGPGDTILLDVLNHAEEPHLFYQTTIEIRYMKQFALTYDSVNIVVGEIWWPAARVASTVEPSPVWQLRASPNPTSGRVRASIVGNVGTKPVRFNVFDVLGNAVTGSSTTTTEWTWNGTDSHGHPVPDGNYFLRAECEDDAGTVSLKTVRIVKGK